MSETMAIRITCPGCQCLLTLADGLRGKKVRCKECAQSLTVPARKGLKTQDEEEDADDTEEQSPPEQPRSRMKPDLDDDEEEEEEDRPARKKKKKKAKKVGSSMPLLVGAGIGVVVLLAVGGAVAFFWWPGRARQNAQAEDKKEDPAQIRIAPKINEGSPTAKGGKGVVNNVRGAVYRTERRSELAGIKNMYAAFILENGNPNQRTLDKFLVYIERDFRPVQQAIKDGYYKVNMRAQLTGAHVIAHERDEDRDGFLAVMGDGDIRYLRQAELNAGMSK
jgi:microcompartment protein CcmK/EutM